MTATNTNSPSVKQERAALRVLDSLDRCDERLKEAYAGLRKYARNAYRTQITVFVPAGGAGNPEAKEATRFQAWARNISQGGLSLVHPGKLTCKRIIVSLNSTAESPTWFHAEIVRAREVQDGFWEHGVKFLERAAV